MTHVHAPLLSIAAAGRLNSGIVIRHTHGLPYFMKRSLPRNPQSQAQCHHRSIVTALTQAWHNNAASVERHWQAWNGYPDLPPYQQYLKENWRRIKLDLWPTVAAPGTTPTTAKNWTATEWEVGPRRISFRGTLQPIAVQAFLAIFIGPPFPSLYSPLNASRLIACPTNPTHWKHALHVLPAHCRAYAAYINTTGLEGSTDGSAWLDVPDA